MKLRVGVVGYGSFSRDFVELFMKHPDVEEVAIAELVEERRQEFLEKYPGCRTFESLDELLETAPEINCVAIFTQRHLHGPMVIKALKAGKHVYSAVPIGCTVDEIMEIVELVKETKLVYMMGETCYYYPSAIYCREKYKEGAFGKFVYAEAQYYHDIREMYGAFSHSGGDSWRRVAGIPPMFYPTHSISMIFPAIGAHATKVSCMGLRDEYPDNIYGEEKNDFENPFSNETAIFRMSDGSVVRINEFRRVGINKPSTYITCFYGEDGAYDCINERHVFQTAPFPHRNGGEGEMKMTDVSELLMPEKYLDLKNGKIDSIENGKFTWNPDVTPVSVAAITGYAKIQNRDRLPDSYDYYEEMAGAHFNSHPFLVDDFVRAVVDDMLPPNNAWDAANYMIPGLIAHESAIRDGELLDIPYVGEAPETFRRMEYIEKDYYHEKA